MSMAEEKQQPAIAPEEEERDEFEREELQAAGEEKTKGLLPPWEQHAAVINLPRYDYGAPSSLLERSRSGFLITCPIKREKSATKEAFSLLKEYVSHTCGNDLENFDSCGTKVDARKRKVCSTVVDANSVRAIERNKNTNILEPSGKTAESSLLSFDTNENANGISSLSLVKLTRSGLLLFTFPNNEFHHVVSMLSNLFCSLGSGKLKSPQWCHRIFPIQETCILLEENLQLVVANLFKEFLGDDKDKLDKPIKFAVGYNRRGIDETELKTKKNAGGTKTALMDRGHCFGVVAGAIKSVAKNAIVDLNSPEVAVLVELLPLSRVPLGSLVVGVSVLPVELVSTKPRLSVRSLVADSKTSKRS
ncbi:uncharacterized protein [Typha latifolia]|uniref:uncharacterized protein n=1 Tax=Typha latifolia TaxID=4733 RepID=UPI003C301BD5